MTKRKAKELKPIYAWAAYFVAGEYYTVYFTRQQFTRSWKGILMKPHLDRVLITPIARRKRK